MAETKEAKETKDPEIADGDLTKFNQLLGIAQHSASDPSLRATHHAARTQLAKLNKVIQDQIDKNNAAAAKAIAEAEAKAVEDARVAKRKAEDEAAKEAAKA
jgi:hypothetical protein